MRGRLKEERKWTAREWTARKWPRTSPRCPCSYFLRSIHKIIKATHNSCWLFGRLRATKHIVNNEDLLSNKVNEENVTVCTACSETMSPTVTVEWSSVTTKGSRGTDIDRLLHVPEFSANLLSVSQLYDMGSTIEFAKTHVKVLNFGNIIGIGKRVNNVYIMTLTRI